MRNTKSVRLGNIKTQTKDTNFIRLTTQPGHIGINTDYTPEEIPLAIDTLRDALLKLSELNRTYEVMRKRKDR
jgi:hypothetical protein